MPPPAGGVDKLVQTDIEVAQEVPQWVQHSMATKVPDDARWVDVYVSVYGVSDRVCVSTVSVCRTVV